MKLFDADHLRRWILSRVFKTQLSVADVIDQIDREDAIEIIRCKDCKYCDRGIDEDGNPFLKCLGWGYGGTQEEDFCSHAERRGDD